MIAAGLDHGYKPSQAARAAAAGQLPGLGAELDPFDMPATTATKLIGAARTERQREERARLAPANLAADALARMGAVIDREVEKLERTSRATGARPNPETVRHWIRAARELKAATKPETRGRPPHAKPEDPADGVAPPDFIDSLAADKQRDNETTAYIRAHSPTPAPDDLEPTTLELAERSNPQSSPELDSEPTTTHRNASKHLSNASSATQRPSKA